MKLTNSQKVDLFDLSFESGYLSKQKELQERIKLNIFTSKMAIHYKGLNDKQKEGEKKDMFAEFLDNVIALSKSNNQNINHIMHELDAIDFYQHKIKSLEAELRIRDIEIKTRNRQIDNILNDK